MSVSEYTKFQVLYKAIRNKICLLEYPPGMALKEEALAAEYGVSRTPIRQVLQRLEYDGLVTNQPGTGVIVTTVDVRSLKEVYALRLKLAEFIGEMLVPHFPEDDVKALEDIVEQVKTLRDVFDPPRLGQYYHQFHSIMNQNIANRPLRQINDQSFHQTARVWVELLPDFDWNEEVNLVIEEISDVVDAIRRQDMIAVGKIRREQMVLLLHRINNYLGSADMS